MKLRCHCGHEGEVPKDKGRFGCSKCGVLITRAGPGKASAARTTFAHGPSAGWWAYPASMTSVMIADEPSGEGQSPSLAWWAWVLGCALPVRFLNRCGSGHA